MGLKSVLRWVIPGTNEEFSSQPAFRCLRCGEEFERDHHACPDCGANFVAPIDESAAER